MRLKKTKDSSRLAFLKREQVKHISILEEYCFDWISKNRNSQIAPIILYCYLQSSSPERIERAFASISEDVRANSVVADNIPLIIARAAENSVIRVGSMFPGFTLNDPSGKQVRSPEPGTYKFLLIDFWASWCGPCRKSNPDLKALVEKYAAKNLRVISVSADDAKSDWLKAIKDDKMTWTQVSDLKGTNEGFIRSMAVYSFPTYVLISADGTVISKPWNLDGIKEKLLEEYGF